MRRSLTQETFHVDQKTWSVVGKQAGADIASAAAWMARREEGLSSAALA
jgi:hypothetical protein